MRCFSTRAMKSAGVYRASADLAKWGFAEMKFSGWQWRFVKLQRPPPEIRIFLPARSARSRTATRRPRLPASIAQRSPAAPAPSTTASNLWTALWGNGASRSSPVIITSLTGPKPAHIAIKLSPGSPRVRRRAIQFHKVCYDADRFCRLDIPASPCDSEDVNSFADGIVPGNTNFEVRSAGPDCSD